LIHLRLAVKDCQGLIQQLLSQKGTEATTAEVKAVVAELPAVSRKADDGRDGNACAPVNYGPLDRLVRRGWCERIVVMGLADVFVQRRGRLQKSRVRFHDATQLKQFVDHLAEQAGRRIESPLIYFRLPDGTRVQGVLPPLAIGGPYLSLEFAYSRRLFLDDLVKDRVLAPEMALLLRAAVQGGLNLLICGGLSGGKTTWLNALGQLIPRREHVLTIQEIPSLILPEPAHQVRLMVQLPGDGPASAPASDVLRYALGLRPDRLLLDECRGKEVWDLFHFMRVSQGGSMATLQAHGPAEARSRLETLAAMADPNVPRSVIHWHIAAAIDLIVQVNRLVGETWKVTSITEVIGQTDDGVRLADLFRYTQTGIDQDGALGQFEATGYRSGFVAHLEARGIKLPANFFEKRVLLRD
jgi:pilus assembly protein CpaF